MKLTDAKIRSIKPESKPQKYFDGDGLFLFVTPAGGKLWRFKYRLQGKEKLLALGAYPEVPLRGYKGEDGEIVKGARDLVQDARLDLRRGVDPSDRKRELRKAETVKQDTFRVIAEEWYLSQKSRWQQVTFEMTKRRLEHNIFPILGERPIREITPAELRKVFDAIAAKGSLDTCRRALRNCSLIFNYAVTTERADKDVSVHLKGVYPAYQGGHQAAITDPKEVGALLRAIDAYSGARPTVGNALRLSPLVFARPGELRFCEWTEIDLDKGYWSIPGEKMKMKAAHIVPLSRQAIQILREQRALTGSMQYVFPSALSGKRPMSNNAILTALRRMGYEKAEMSGHGFRAMARTILDEVLCFPIAHIEQQLAHKVPDPLGRAYNRTHHLPQRKEMMQKWADYLDTLRTVTVSV